jgi:hypothetical protein
MKVLPQHQEISKLQPLTSVGAFSLANHAQSVRKGPLSPALHKAQARLDKKIRGREFFWAEDFGR